MYMSKCYDRFVLQNQGDRGDIFFQKYSFEINCARDDSLENVVNTVNPNFTFFCTVSAGIYSVFEKYRFCSFSKISTEITFNENHMFLVDLFCLYSSVLCIVRREIWMFKHWRRGFAIIRTLNGPKYYVKIL